MQRTLRVLLVTALVAPILFLTGCCGTGCEKEKSYDKCGVEMKADGK